MYSLTLDVPLVTTLVIDDLSFRQKFQTNLTKRKPVPIDIYPDEGPKRPRVNPTPQGPVVTGSDVWEANSWATDPSHQFNLPLYRDSFGTVWVLQPNPTFNGTNPRYRAWMSLNNWELEHGWNAATPPTAPPPEAPVDADTDEEEEEVDNTEPPAPVNHNSRQEMLQQIRDYRKRMHRIRIQQHNDEELKHIRTKTPAQPASPFMDPPKVPRKTLLDTPALPRPPVRVPKRPLKDAPVPPGKRRLYDQNWNQPEDQSRKHTDKENFFAFYDVPGSKGISLPLDALPKGTPGTESRVEFDLKPLGVANAGPGNTVSSFDEAVKDGPVSVAAWIHDIQISAATTAEEKKKADRDFIEFLYDVPVVKRDGAWHVAKLAIQSGVQNLWYYIYGL